MSSIATAALVSLIPFAVVWLAALTIKIGKPSALLVLITQATAAGFILASICTEFMPRVLQSSSITVAIGFLLGFLLMLFVQRLGGDCCSSTAENKPLAPFLIPYAVEFFINAVLIGIASATNHVTLVIIAISLSLCCFVCSMSVATRIFSSALEISQKFILLFAMALLFPIGTVLGAWVMVSMPSIWLIDLLSFSIAALFYLVTVELLHEAFAKKNQKAISAFFLAFLFVLLLHMWL